MPHRALSSAAIVAFAAAAASAQPFDTLKFDFNQLSWFSSGVDRSVTEQFTGQIQLGVEDGFTRLQPVEGRDGGLLGPFSVAGDGGQLPLGPRTFVALEFVDGALTFGRSVITNDAGDRISFDLAAEGRLRLAPGGYLTLDTLVSEGQFDDAGTDRLFGGGVDLSDFYTGRDAVDAVSNTFFGDFSAFRFTNGDFGGTVDAELVVTAVPTPGAAALLAVGAGLARRRRL